MRAVREPGESLRAAGLAGLVVLVRSGTDDVAEGNLSTHERVHDRLDARRHAEPPLRMLDVVVHGALADPEDPARDPVALALRGQLQALTLAPRQAARNASCPASLPPRG